jgi:sulfite reductase alpha subunit-like flavoprotein
MAGTIVMVYACLRNANQMPKQVREAFVELVKEAGELGHVLLKTKLLNDRCCLDHVSMREAEIFIAHMEKSGRYQVETWS